MMSSYSSRSSSSRTTRCRYRLDTSVVHKQYGVGVLGQGTYGKVYKVIDTTTQTPYALKTADTDACANTLISTVEMDILMRLNHPNLLNGVDVFRRADVDTCGVPLDNVQQGVLLPLMSSDLEALLLKGVPFNAVSVAWQAACGLETLHQAGYTHFDIKPANMLVDGDRVVLSDFGLSMPFTMPQLDHPVVSATYRAPFVTNRMRSGLYANSLFVPTDIYALGVVFLEMTVGLEYIAYTNDTLYIQQMSTMVQRRTNEFLAYIPRKDMASLRTNIPTLASLTSLDQFVAFFTLIKDMITTSPPSSLTARDVRERIESFWPLHPPVTPLAMAPLPPKQPMYEAAASHYIASIVNSMPSRTVILRSPLVDHFTSLFCTIMAFAQPIGYLQAPLPSWSLPYLYACWEFMTDFYSLPFTSNRFMIALDGTEPAYEALIDRTYSGPMQSDLTSLLCEAKKVVLESPVLRGRFNTLPRPAAASSAASSAPTLSTLMPPASAPPMSAMNTGAAGTVKQTRPIARARRPRNPPKASAAAAAASAAAQGLPMQRVASSLGSSSMSQQRQRQQRPIEDLSAQFESMQLD
jgi:serine/threonine protein kinase